MRYLLTLTLLTLAGSTADAQFRRSAPQPSCPSGGCPQAQPFGLPTAPGGTLTMPAKPAAGEHELWLENGVLVWKPKAGAAIPQAIPAGLPAPKFVDAPSSAKDQHGRMFYRHVVDRAYRGLVEKGVAPDEARKRVESLSHESIDVYGQHVGISGKIGDGTLLQWLLDHSDQIAALIKLIISLLAFA